MTDIVPASNKNRLLVMAIALLILFIPLFLIIRSVLEYSGGIFSYPVDDAFIHMQLAENLSEHGTWGVNSHEFASASSSVLYTILLAALFAIFPSHEYIPFIVNCIAGILLLFVVQRWLNRHRIGTPWQLTILLLLIVVTPLPTLILSGMEHTIQCLFSILFITSFCDWLTIDRTAGKKNSVPWNVIVFAMLTVTTRYEGLFLVGMACLILLWYRKTGSMLKLGILASLPVLIFGLISISKGSYFFPNSLLVKSEAAQFSLKGVISSLGNILIQKLTFSEAGVTLLATQKLLVFLPLVYLVFRKALKQDASLRYMLLILTGATLIHLLLADTGKFYRYEAYLISGSVLCISVLLVKHFRALPFEKTPLVYALSLLILFFLLFPVALRSMAAFSKARQACINIYEQQYQMGRFLQQYFPDETIAANDIGAVSYYTRGEVVDLWGLGTIEIARSKKGGYWTAPFLDSFTKQKNTGIAVIYDSWIGKSIPGNWQKLASWRIFNNVVCGDDVVYYYAVDPAAAPKLMNSLKAYEPRLPKAVEVQYY